jgi:hypothetical protein
MPDIIEATDSEAWRSAMSVFGEIDPSYLPEYHLAYSLRVPRSRPVLWVAQQSGQRLVYPFLLTPVVMNTADTGFYDISSVYGYTGPLATTDDPAFLAEAWRQFDDYAASQRIIAEFVRFSPFNHTERFAHPKTSLMANRLLAVSNLPASEETLLQKLGSKTRNMLRKAERAGLVARELTLSEGLADFRNLYHETMERNQAPVFFRYDDAYWQHLLKLGKDGLRLFAVFHEQRMVAASMAVVHGQSALYHLGASKPDYARLGAGNLSLYAMSVALMQTGVTFINMTGGRTQAEDDPLLLFKKSNATDVANFYIGKRVVDEAAYRQLQDSWLREYREPADPAKIIFWRA